MVQLEKEYFNLSSVASDDNRVTDVRTELPIDLFA